MTQWTGSFTEDSDASVVLFTLADLCISSRLQIHPVLSDPTATVSFSIQRGIWILN